MRQDAADGDCTQGERHDAQRNVNGRDEPKGEQVERLVAVLSFTGIIVRLVLLEDPERADDEPAEHEEVDQLLRGRLAFALRLLLLSAPHPRR